MAMAGRRVAVVVLHSLLLGAPLAAEAQAVKAGIVTTAEGHVTARRVVLPQPVPLKFKDDVFLQDTITTGDRSLARLLLAGKALVTVRERSVLTVTEVPGRSTVDMDSGKIGLVVARDRMRPGEVIDVRTPNAIVAVRGTVLVVEVRRATAQAGAGVGAPTTDVYLLKDFAEVTPVDPATRAPIGPVVALSPMQRLTLTGTAPPRITSFTTADMPGIAEGLQPSGVPHQQAANPEQVKGMLLDTTAALLAAVTGTGPERLALAPAETTTSSAPPEPVETAPTAPPIIPDVAPALQEQAVTPSVPAPAPEPTPPPGRTKIVIPAGQSLFTFSGEFLRPETTPLLPISDATVTQEGPNDLIVVLSRAQANLASLMLDVTNSDIAAGRHLLRVDGFLSGAHPAGLIAVDPSTLTSAGDLIRVNPGGKIFTTGPLLSAADTRIVTDPGQLLHVVGDPSSEDHGFVATSGTLLSFTGSHLDLANNLVRLVDGGILGQVAEESESPTDRPLVVFRDSTYRGGLGPGTVTGGSLLRMFSGEAGMGSTLFLTGPYLDAVGSTFESREAPLFNIADGSFIFSESSKPFASLDRSRVTSASHFFSFDTHTQFGPPPDAPPGTLPTVGSGDSVFVFLSSSLLRAIDTSFTLNGSFLRLHNGAFLVVTGPSPLIALEGSVPGGVRVTASGNLLNLSAGPDRPAPQLTLGGLFEDDRVFRSVGGTLLSARNAVFTTGDPAANVFSFAFIGDGARLVALGPDPLFMFEGTSLDTAGAVLTLRRSRPAEPSPADPSTVGLAGPLLVARNSSFDTTSLGFENAFGVTGACCSGFFISQGARLTSSTTEPLIQLTSSVFNAGPDAQSGGTFFGVADTFTGTPAGEVVAPASVSLAGPLLRATDSTIKAAFHLLEVRRSSLSSSSPDPLIQLVGSTGTGSGLTTVTLGGTRTDPISPGTTSFGTVLTVVSGPSSGTSAPPASVSLAGPLLSATKAAITTTGDVILVLNGATLSSTTTAPLVQLSSSSLTAGTRTVNGDLLDVEGTGWPSGTVFATVSLQGPLVSAASTLNLTGGLAGVFAGGVLSTTEGAEPLAVVTGGTHSIATNPGTAVFRLFGRPAATTTGTVVLPELETSVVLVLGADRPLAGVLSGAVGRPLFAASGATVNTQSVMRVDTALLEATLPALGLKSGSTLTSATDAFDLSSRAKVSTLGPLLTLDASTLNVTNGALIRLANSSFLDVAGDLLSLSNGSRLNLSNGAVLNVTGNSVARIGGAFVAFGGSDNQINITNNACGGAECMTFGPVRVALTGGATGANVSIGGNVIKGSGGVINYSSPQAAAIVVNGSGSRVVIRGQ